MRSRWLWGKRSSRSPRVAMPASAAASASFGPTPARAKRRTRPARSAAASGRRPRAARRGQLRVAREAAHVPLTGPPAATTSSAARPRASRSRPRRGRGCRSPSSGIGASSPAITVTISAPSARRRSSPPGSSRRRPRRRSRRRRSRPRRPCGSVPGRRRGPPRRRRRWRCPSSAASSRSAFSWPSVASGSSSTSASRLSCWEVGAHHPGRLLGELAGALGGHDHVGGAGQDEDLLGRRPRGSRRAARRSTG